MSIEETFVIIKPDSIDRGIIGKIISRFEDKNLKITSIFSRVKDDNWYRSMYPHRAKDKEMEMFLTDTLLIGIVLVGFDAIRVVRQMVGATDSSYAQPGTIRGDFGRTDRIMYNCVHASDSTENVIGELALFCRQ